MRAAPKTRALAREGAVVALALGVMNAATYAFTVVAARLLGPVEYSALASLIAILTVVFVVSLGVQATGARKIAARPASQREVEAGLMSATHRASLALGVLCLALTPVLAIFFDLPALSTLMIALSAVPLTIMGGQAGILQGTKRWRALGVLYVAFGVGRLLVGAAAMLLSPTALAAMIGVAVAAWLPVLVGRVALGHERSAPSRTSSRGFLREIGGDSHALLIFFALSNVDVVMARVVLDDVDAGLYAGGLILTKAVLFLPQFVVVLIFPSMAEGGRQRVHLLGLGVTAGIGLSATLATWLLSSVAVIFIGGDAYADIADRVGWFALLGTVLAMVQLMVYEVVARQHHRAVVLLWAGFVAVAAGVLLVDDIESMLTTVLVIDSILLVSLVALTSWLTRARKPVDEHSGTS